ncbi:hypothetical protein PsorP6_002837 [Peronosclerospora sorghi]|uniref:Uncharacterized protein n=1 Tax=Peronosclerospora sorghi TaxID=230839 RepID=A0ACC0VLX0_9STRA|nr:hypothetical protein PsorP6_002837 [Peronosclerospora sorghi]
MNTLYLPMDECDAIQRKALPDLASPCLAIPCCTRKLQSAISTPTYVHNQAHKYERVVTPSHLPRLLALAKTNPWLSSQEKSIRTQSLVVVKDQDQPRKRMTSVAISPLPGVKRRRVSIHSNYSTIRRGNELSDRMAVPPSVRSLQYALPGLSSHDTLHMLHAMRTVPSELRHLNGSASRYHLKSRSNVRQVFGWRHLLCQEGDDEKAARRVVWKSAKAVESMKMRPLARQIWKASTEGPEEGEMGEVLYTVNQITRVVQSTKQQYGNRRSARDQIWIECYLDDGLQVCVARKELRYFGKYSAPETSATECQGFLVRPLYTRAIQAHSVGCSLQCLRAVDVRDCGVPSAPALKQRMLDDLPRLTLQCEEEYFYDLVQVPQVLLDSVFALWS